MMLQAKPTKTQNAVDLLHQVIAAGCFKRGDRLPSTRTLATHLGVSQIVLRNACTRLAGEGVLECRPCSGVYLKRAATQPRAVAILSEMDISHPRASYFYRCMIEQTRLALERAGCKVLLQIGRQQPGAEDLRLRDAVDDLIEAHAEGKISTVVMISGLTNESWREKCRSLGVPFVGPYSRSDGKFLRSSFTINTRKMITDAVAYLAARGVRRPALVSWDKSQSRIFKRCVIEAGMEYHPELTYVRSGNKAGDACGYRGFHQVWSRLPHSRPDAVLFSDDILFMDARLAIAEVGVKIPTQLQVVTHYNLGSGILIPFPATLLAVDPRVVAAELAAMALELAGDPRVTGRKKEFQFKLLEHKPQTTD